MAALEVVEPDGGSEEILLKGTWVGSHPSSRGQAEELTHGPKMNKGLLLREPISDTTMCPKGTCDPRQASFPALWTVSHSVLVPSFA